MIGNLGVVGKVRRKLMSAAEFGYEKPYNRPFGPKKPYNRGFAPMELKPTSLTLGRAPARSSRRSRTNTTGEGTAPFFA